MGLDVRSTLRLVGKPPARVEPMTDGSQRDRLSPDLAEADMVAMMYRQYRDLVVHLALRYGGGRRAWAEDITQDVFVRLFKHVRHVNALDEPRGWFYRVTTNLCLNRLRRERYLNRPVVRWLLRQSFDHRDPEQIGLTHDLLRRAFERIEALPPKVRVCMFMHHVDGLPQVEIAEILGHSKGYVSKLVARGEAALAELATERRGP